MYLSKITCSYGDAMRARATDSYHWHQLIWEMFPDQKDRNFLFRVKEDTQGVEVLVQSEKKPCQSPVGRIVSKKIPSVHLDGTRYVFQACLNPTVRRKSSPNAKSSKRVGLYKTEEVFNWCKRKFEVNGMAIESLIVRDVSRETSYKKGAELVLSKADVSGVLTVSDPAKFRQAIADGVGPAKSFGYGLVLLKKA